MQVLSATGFDGGGPRGVSNNPPPHPVRRRGGDQAKVFFPPPLRENWHKTVFKVGARDNSTINWVLETYPRFRQILHKRGKIYFDWVSCSLADLFASPAAINASVLATLPNTANLKCNVGTTPRSIMKRTTALQNMTLGLIDVLIAFVLDEGTTTTPL